MKASYFGCMGYQERDKFPAGWPVPPSYYDPEVAMQSYRDGMAECRLAEEAGFDWVSLSEHHYSGNRTTPNPAVMAAAVAQQCQRVKIALLGQLLPILNPVRAAEEIGMLDNLTEGRLVVAFMRGTLSEDQVYSLNPVEGRDKLLERNGPGVAGVDRTPALFLGGPLLPLPHRVRLAQAGAAASASDYRSYPQR